jgi:1-acyl-sn-glycerol-3-phosphate acyltransferase
VSVRSTAAEPVGGVERRSARWARRAKTIPVVLAVTAVGTVLSPALGVAALGADVAAGRRRLPTVRTWLFVWQYLLNDTVEIVAAPVLWMAAGFGSRLGSPLSVRRHERLAAWSVAVMARRAEHLLGVRVEIDADSLAALEPGPLIVACRHVNLLDSSLPSVLYQGRGVHLRGVIMAEMLADPGFDLLYGRLRSVFVPRDNAPDAIAALNRLGASLDPDSVAVLFPEGRLFRPELLTRARQRLAERDPERAERLVGLRHVLPPRPAGICALLDAAPTADVVIIAHVGLDDYPRFADLAHAVPLRHPIRVVAWRIRRSDIPASRADRAGWLDDQWRRVDDWVDRHRALPDAVVAR